MTTPSQTYPETPCGLRVPTEADRRQGWGTFTPLEPYGADLDRPKVERTTGSDKRDDVDGESSKS
jgi:hypothetical protein